MSGGTEPGLSIRLFGRFEVRRGSDPIPSTSWGRRKTLTLLKVLLTNPGHTFTQDQLIEALYGEENPQAKSHNLRGRISQLRHALEPQLEHRGPSRFVTRVGDGYRFESDDCWIDTEVFQERLRFAAKAKESGQWNLAADAYETGLDLVRGDFLEEDRYEEWAFERRENLREETVKGLSALAQCYAQLQQFDRAVECCDRALRVVPTAETIARQLMEYAYQAGDPARSLLAYRNLSEALVRDLAVRVSAETEELHQEIQEGDLPKAAPDLDPLRLAVLPLVNIGATSRNAYFADGMTEELIHRLSRVNRLQVIAQTSVLAYRGVKKTAAQIGRELRVGTILEGSVRKSGKALRITVQLIDVASETHLWSVAYEERMHNVFAIQASIADKVADALRVELLDQESRTLAAGRTEDPVAYDLYLRGRHQLATDTAEGFQTAIAYFEEAIRIDPEFASAYAGLADVWYSKTRGDCVSWEEGFGTARKFAEKALELDPELSEAHASMGHVAWTTLRDPEESERHYRKALECAPGNAHAHYLYADLLMNWDRNEEALKHMEEALVLDPLSPRVNTEMGNALFWGLGDVEGALRCFRRAREIDPQHPWGQSTVGYVMAFAGDWIGAEEARRKLIEQYPEDPGAREGYALFLGFLGRFPEALRELEVAGKLSGWTPQLQSAVAETLFGARRYEEAIKVLQDVLDSEPNLVQAHMMLGAVRGVRGEYPAAQAQFEHVANMVPLSSWAFPWANAWSACVYAWAGDTAQARKRIDGLLTQPGCRITLEHLVACVYFALGDLDLGFEWLERSLEIPTLLRFRLGLSPFFDVVHSDPRFQDILVRTGFAKTREDAIAWLQQCTGVQHEEGEVR